MTQLEQMQQVISNYVKNFRPESYMFFTTYGISPEHLNPSNYKELPEEQLDNMRKAFDSITQQTKNNGSMFYQQKTAETDDWMYFGFAQDEYTRMKSSDLNCRIYLPIAEGASHDYFMAECLKILINSEIKFTGKVAKTYRNDSLMFEFEEKEHAKKFVELFMRREDLRGMLGLHNPFLRDVQGLGFVDFENFNPNEQSYTSLVAHELEDYVFGLQAEDMQHGKEKASVEGFKKFLEQEKTNPHKNSAMLDQIIGEIEHCETLHLQSINNSTQRTNQSSPSHNTSNMQNHINIPHKEKSQNLEPKSIGDSFDELKVLFETYELIEANNGIGLKDRKTGEFVKTENNLQQLVEKVTFAKKWIEAAGVDLSLSGGMNEFGIDPKQYEMAFNDGARATFESMFGGLAQMGQSGQNFDLSQLQQFVQNGTGYKYSSSLVKGLLSNPQGEEVYLPQYQGIPTKKPWEYSIIKREIENIALANQMAKTTDATNTQSEQEKLQNEKTISEHVKNTYDFNLIDEVLEQQNINFKDSEYHTKYDELRKLSKAELFKLLGKEEYAIEAERQDKRKKTIEDICEKEDGNPYRDIRSELEQLTDEELSKRLQRAEENIERKQRAAAEREAYHERQKNKPNEDERSRIYNLGLKVVLLQKRMNELGENGQLKEIPEKYIQSINNTIQNLLHLSEKTIVGENGQSKSVTEIIGRLWDMRSEDAIACVESELSSGKIQDVEIINILQDFAVSKKLIPQSYTSKDYSCMPQSGEYNMLYNEWRADFINRTGSCYTIEDVYGKLESESNGEASYFFKKKKDEYAQYPDEFLSDESFAQRFLERMKEGIKNLEMSDDLAM